VSATGVFIEIPSDIDYAAFDQEKDTSATIDRQAVALEDLGSRPDWQFFDRLGAFIKRDRGVKTIGVRRVDLRSGSTNGRLGGLGDRWDKGGVTVEKPDYPFRGIPIPEMSTTIRRLNRMAHAGFGPLRKSLLACQYRTEGSGGKSYGKAWWKLHH
jgi:hypothetical protein